ncbi:septation protein SepH [Lysinimonas soli]|uniref:Septation protein SepH n=1 Tax=Lysinimonas soli TaxID=1074233 RepID=A0ABW0NNY4_9MICO
MEELKVIGVENGALLVASDEGTRFRLAIDEVLQSRLRQTSPEPGMARKLAPRDVQAHIRSGMSAEDVAAVTGAPLEYIQRFEGPVLAEREYVIESALNVTVHTAVETDPLAEGATFGAVIRSRLAEMGAISERWASWKEQGGGWIVKLTFVAEQIERDARWSFEPKKSALSPLNPEAVSLSQQGELPASLLPRLRAVPLDEGGDSGRFDSGAFQVAENETGQAPGLEAVSMVAITEFETGIIASGAVQKDAAPASTNQTADLLEALRRRRGERDPMDLEHEESMAAHPSTGTVRLIDIPLDTATDNPVVSKGTPSAGATRDTAPLGKTRRGRTAMPSWDEIVFGARTDDDL